MSNEQRAMSNGGNQKKAAMSSAVDGETIKKTRSGGRNSSLVLPGHGDKSSIANKGKKVKPNTRKGKK